MTITHIDCELAGIKPGRFDISSFKTDLDGKNIELRFGVIKNKNSQTTTSKSLIFVPGLGGSVKGALDFLEGLLENYDSILAMDLPGFGLNTHINVCNPNFYVPLLNNFLKAKGPAEIIQSNTLGLAGISLGGSTATHWVTSHPELFEALILIAPAYKPSKQSFPLPYVLKNVGKYLLKGADASMTLPYDIRSLTRNQSFLNNPNNQQKHFEPLTLPTQYMLSLKGFNGKANQLAKDINTPTLILVPEQDVVCDPDAMKKAYQAMANKYKQLKLYPQAYHDLLIEPELPEIINDVNNWLNTL